LCSVAFGGGGGDYCDHKFFESGCIHVLVIAVNNDKVTLLQARLWPRGG